MACDESLYRQYLSGDDEGLNALMKKYGDPLTLYIDGYLHDVHEAEELIAYGGAAQYIAYALPVLLVAAGRWSAFRLSQRK